MTATNETAVAVRGTGAVGLPTNNMNDLVRAGQLLAQSGMFGINNDGAGFVVAATCHQQGISLMEFQRSYHIVDGRPSMRADAMLAELRKRGGKHRIVENSVNRAAIEIEFEGQKLPFAFSMDDAKRTGDCYQKDGKTLKHAWAKRPEDMLWARCVSRAVRRICPEIVAGLYTPEEVADFSDPPNRAAPVQIAPTVAAERARKPVTIDAEPVITDENMEPVETMLENATICPNGFGELSGVAWDDMEPEVLTSALESDDPRLEPGHRMAIKEALARKGVEA